MRSKIFSSLAVLLIFAWNASLFAGGFQGKVGFSPNGGIIMPLNGGFSAVDDLKDVVKTGPNFGFAVRYGLTNTFALEGAFAYQWMALEDDQKPVSNEDPTMVLPAITLNGIYNFGPAIGLNNSIAPFISAGGGLFPWKIAEDGISGDALRNGNEDLSKTSFGLNAGAGVEYFFSEQASLTAGLNYQFVFAKDEDKFGKDFDNQGFMKFNLGFTFYLPTAN